MAQLSPSDPKLPTIQRELKAIQNDITALWRRLNKRKGGGDGLVYVQPDEPLEAETGSLWYDTDAGV